MTGTGLDSDSLSGHKMRVYEEILTEILGLTLLFTLGVGGRGVRLWVQNTFEEGQRCVERTETAGLSTLGPMAEEKDDPLNVGKKILCHRSYIRAK